jgi:hypothetical protein
MRTTLTIDDGLLRQLRQKALDSGKPFKQVVNETLEAGLAGPPATVRTPYRCPVFSIGALAPGVDLTQANQLAASLEDDLLIERLRQGMA